MQVNSIKSVIEDIAEINLLATYTVRQSSNNYCDSHIINQKN